MASSSGATDLPLARSVLRVLAVARSAEEAKRAVLAESARAFGRRLGVLWLADDSGLLRWSGDWAVDGSTDELSAACRRLTFAPGVGLPGTVFAGVQPGWVDDVAFEASRGEETEFPRAQVALRAGLRSVVAVPVVAAKGPIGVMELFADAPGTPAREEVEALGSAAQSLAEYLHRLGVEERLRISEESSAAIVNAALDCIVTMDHRGRVVDLNPAAETTFGYTRDEAVGERLADLIIPPELRAAHEKALAAYVEHGRPTILNRRLELVGLRADGATIPVELTVTRLGAEDPPVFAGFVRDITERREAQGELSRLLELEHAQRLRAEQSQHAARGAAEALQRSLLPPHLPSIAGLELGAAYRAGAEGWEVGGDFYDVFQLAERQWALVIGDVCGKGVEAAAMTTMVRYAVRAAAVRHRAASDVLHELNETLLRQSPRGDFFTAVFAFVDVSGAEPVVRLSNGGHPPPLLLEQSGRVGPVGRSGTLLGAFEGAVAYEDELTLAPGEALLLYTDGVTEARTPAGLFGPERLMRLVEESVGSSAAELAHVVETAVSNVAGPGASDDLAVLALRVART